MYRLYLGVLIILLLNGCAVIDGSRPIEASPDIPRQTQSYQTEKQALFGQPYIDPLTDYLIEHQGDGQRKAVLEAVRQERDQRCQNIAAEYKKEPATQQVLERYNFGYGYSCPEQVAAFEARVTERTAESSDPVPESEPEPPSPTPRAIADPPAEPSVSDQARSDCYLLTTIRNFSAAREACREPADKGDVRSQTNMAVVAHAFEDYASAFDWAEKAAPASDRAAFLLGRLYASGRGVGQNMEQAIYWYREAARQGNKEAQAAIDSYVENGSSGDT